MEESGSQSESTVPSESKPPTLLKVLTVGDGDLTFSLALKRAYPKISVTASTLLPSSQELIQTYSNSQEIINEFQNVWNETILFGVDATRLKPTLISALTSSTHSSEKNGGSDNDGGNQLMNSKRLESACETSIPKYDIIMFNHPHLGDALLQESEELHAKRHYSLLCHYFHSAKQLISGNNGDCDDSNSISKLGRIHVCLCGTQPQTWSVIDAAKRHGLVCSVQEKTASPMQMWLLNNDTTSSSISSANYDVFSKDTNNNQNDNDDDRGGLIMEPAKVQTHYKAPRRYRNGKLGSKHFLGKYGYRHRRTGGDLFTGNESDMMVQQSINFIFQKRVKNNDNDDCHLQATGNLKYGIPLPVQESLLECDICGITFTSKIDLISHLESPATPDVMIGEGRYKNKIEGTAKKKTRYNDNNCQMGDDNEVLSPNNELKAINYGDEYKHLKKESNVIVESSVPSHYDGKRLRWCCRQADLTISKFATSKKHCETLITSGRVYVNKSLALDSSRIVTTGDIITMIEEKKSVPNVPEQNNHSVEIVKVIPTCKNDIKIVVAFKPVGVRTVGKFSSQTLEMIVTRLLVQKEPQTGIICNSITKLETGCAGLCVLTAATQDKGTISSEVIIDINYEFTALVHGSVPSDWDDGVFVNIPGNGSRRWNSKRKDQGSNNPLVQDNLSSNLDHKCQNKDDTLELPNNKKSEGSSVFIKCQQRFNHCVNDQPELSFHLSTVTIKSNLDSGKLSNSLCFLFRKAGFPVVNDRFCKRELSQLPRIMRNILKNKLCIGCYSIELMMSDTCNKRQIIVTNIKPKSRTLCSHWQDVLS